MRTRDVVSDCAALGLLAGCGGTYLNRNAQLSSPNKLDASATAYISTPADGRYGNTIYHGSGPMVTQIIRGALLKHLSQADEAESAQPVAAAGVVQGSESGAY